VPDAIRRLVDSDVASYIVRGHSDALSYRPLLSGFDTVISFVTLGEMLRGARQANWGARRVAELETSLLDEFSLLPYDANVAREWARLVATCSRRGFKPGQNDAWIAATALAFDCTLVARDSAFKTMERFEARLRVVP
jgi:predicted nucleic acid-binding protein